MEKGATCSDKMLDTRLFWMNEDRTSQKIANIFFNL